MGFQGNLKTLSFPDLLQLLTIGSKTGTLHIKKKDTVKHLYFKDGMIIYADSSTDEDRLENTLLRLGKLNRDDITRAKEVEKLTGKELPSTIIYLNLMSKDELADIVRMQVEDIIFDIFSWEEGEFVFDENVLPDTDVIINSINTMNILMEGSRRIDEWNRIKDILPPENTILRVAPADFMGKQEVSLSPEEVQVLSLVDGERSIEEILDITPTNRLGTMQAIYNLIMSGVIQKVGAKKSRRVRIKETDDVVATVVKIYDSFLRGITEVILSKFGRGGEKIIARLFESAKEKYPILKNLRLSDDCIFDFSNFAELARKIPSESRVHEVSTSLSVLLEAFIEKINSSLGPKRKKEVVSNIIEATEETLKENRELLVRYGVWSDITRVLET